MKSFARLALTAAALAAAATASAAPFDSADQARRERNREEVLARYGTSPADYRTIDETAAPKPSLRDRTHRAAQATRGFGHRTADKMRNFGARQDAKFDRKASPPKDPYQHGPS